MVQKTPDLKTKAGLSQLNDHLKSRSYVSGFVPSHDDCSTFEQLTGGIGHDLPHLLRWYNHIKSYSAQERSRWPKGDSHACAAAPAAKEADADEDIDLFGSDEEDDAEKDRVKEERLKAYAEKKAKKPGPIAKSNVILDVKPWDDETDLKEMEKKIREIQMDGLLWGASKTVPVAYGVNKVQISCVIEDDKVSVDLLEEMITANEDFVQSVDIAAFNKI